MYCTKCGTEITSADAKFCMKCGQPLAITPTPASDPLVSATPVPGRNKESPPKPPTIGEEGLTELMHCAAESDLEGCKRLLDQGANINQQDDKGATALIYAVLNNCEEVTRLLLSKGADQNLATKKNGQTPLAIAEKHGFITISKLLDHPIWNHNAVAAWSLLFTPAFSSYFQMLNWRTLGETEKAASAKKWFFSSLVMLVAFFIMRGSDNPKSISHNLAGLMYIIFFLSWYFSSGREQGKYVKEKCGSNCILKPFGMAFLLGFAAIFSFCVVILSDLVIYVVKTLK